MSAPARHTVLRLAEVETADGPDGLRWSPLRRLLGVGAFGVNAYTADAGARLVEEHDETTYSAGGHEELYLVVGGHATFLLDGGEVDAPAGTQVFVRDVSVRRGALAVADGTTVLAVGGAPGEAYRPGAWEWSFAAGPLAAKGDFEGAAGLLQEGLEEHPGDASLTYNLACYRSLDGRHDEAVALLRSIAADPLVTG